MGTPKRKPGVVGVNISRLRFAIMAHILHCLFRHNYASMLGRYTTGQDISYLRVPKGIITQPMREGQNGHHGMAFWLTGMSGAGKSTIAHLVETELFKKNYQVVVLDGDALRSGLCADLGFSAEERFENNRRAAELAKIFVENGIICICAFISPSAASRENAKRIIGAQYFREIFIDCALEECERRDVKGFYARARRGEIKNYTGISAGYEPPSSPDCIIKTSHASKEESAAALVGYILTEAACQADAGLVGRLHQGVPTSHAWNNAI